MYRHRFVIDISVHVTHFELLMYFSSYSYFRLKGLFFLLKVWADKFKYSRDSLEYDIYWQDSMT